MATNSNVQTRKRVPSIMMVLQNNNLIDEEKFAKIMQLYPEQKKLLTTEQLDELVSGVHEMSALLNWRQPTLYLKCAQVFVMIGTSEARGWVEEMESRVKHAKDEEHWATLEPLLSQLQQLIPGKVRAVQLEKMLAEELQKPVHSHAEQNQFIEPVRWVSDHWPLFAKQLVLFGLERTLNDGRFDECEILKELEEALTRMLMVRLPSLCDTKHPVHILCTALHQRVKDLIELDEMIHSQKES